MRLSASFALIFIVSTLSSWAQELLPVYRCGMKIALETTVTVVTPPIAVKNATILIISFDLFICVYYIRSIFSCWCGSGYCPVAKSMVLNMVCNIVQF